MDSPILAVLLESFLIAMGWFLGWYLLTWKLHNASLVDIGWGSGFVLLSVWQWISYPSLTGLMVALPVAIWGARLSWHIARRNIGKPEDFRYTAFRREWGKWYMLRSLFQLFLFQGLLLWVISLPFLTGIMNAGWRQDSGMGEMSLLFHEPFAAMNVWRWVQMGIGAVLWLAGFITEGTADRQLRAFVARPENRGKILDSGLWSISRHPNHFGDAVMWWGLFLMALALGSPIWTVAGPLLINLFLRYVSGVPMLEKRLAEKPGFEAYAARTPIFTPWLRPTLPREKTKEGRE